MTNLSARAEAGEDAAVLPTCTDYDEDCWTIPDKVHCYLYDPVKGMCPYLRKPAIARSIDDGQ